MKVSYTTFGLPTARFYVELFFEQYVSDFKKNKIDKAGDYRMIKVCQLK